MYCGEFSRGVCSRLIKFGLEIHGSKGFTKMDFYLVWFIQTFGLYLLGSILFFGPSFSHLICCFTYFLQIQWHFSNSKWEFGTFSLN